ncbi:hypothetical protein WNM05_14200 [Chromobacterium sp. CV08]
MAAAPNGVSPPSFSSSFALDRNLGDVRLDVFDRILDRIEFLAGVPLVGHQRAQGGGLAGAGFAGDDGQTRRAVDRILQHLHLVVGIAQLRQRQDVLFHRLVQQHPQHDVHAAVLLDALEAQLIAAAAYAQVDRAALVLVLVEVVVAAAAGVGARVVGGGYRVHHRVEVAQQAVFRIAVPQLAVDAVAHQHLAAVAELEVDIGGLQVHRLLHHQIEVSLAAGLGVAVSLGRFGAVLLQLRVHQQDFLHGADIDAEAAPFGARAHADVETLQQVGAVQLSIGDVLKQQDVLPGLGRSQQQGAVFIAGQREVALLAPAVVAYGFGLQPAYPANREALRRERARASGRAAA